MNVASKKRGRKVKSTITINENPVFNNKELNDLIIHIPKTNSEINYNIDNYDYSDNNECIDYVNINICDNCSDKLSNNYIQLPHKYIKGIFYVSNVFCSFECCCRYCIDNYSDPFEYISLLNLYYNKLLDSNDKSIISSKPISKLKINGGNLSICEYKKYFKKICLNNNNINIKLNVINIIDKDITINNDKLLNLKLYRKYKANKKPGIVDIMNLDIVNN